MKKDLA
jgi:hypothetical protein